MSDKPRPAEPAFNMAIVEYLRWRVQDCFHSRYVCGHMGAFQAGIDAQVELSMYLARHGRLDLETTSPFP